MLGLGLSLSLGGNSNVRASPPPPFCDAIKRKLCVTARDGETLLKLAPHVVYKRGRREIVTVDAVLLAREGHTVSGPAIRTYPVAELSDVAVTNDEFTVDPDFEADDPAFVGRVVCIVDAA